MKNFLFQLAKLRIELNELREALDDSVKGEDFARAAEIKEQIAELEKKSENINLANQAQNQTVRIEKVRNRLWKILGLSFSKKEFRHLQIVVPKVLDVD